jgi:hypothetical protein
MLSARVPLAGLYRVEVSGWDTNDAFFVEKSDLEWSEETGKRVGLCNAVLDGEVVFLRLLPSLGAEQPQPTPYEAEFVALTPKGQRQFRLRPVHPRATDHGSIH